MPPIASISYLLWQDGIIACRCGATYRDPIELESPGDVHIAWWVSVEFPPALHDAPFLGVCRSCGTPVFHHRITECLPKPPSKTIQQRFAEFHSTNPEVYEYIQLLVSEIISRGFKHYAIRPIWERMRWHFQIERGMGDDFKLNDHYHSRYVRMLVEDHPELQGFFELRRLKAT